MKRLLLTLISVCMLAAACKKSSTGSTPDAGPSNLNISAVVNPDSSGNVSFTATATNAVSFDFDFGDGNFQTVPSGVVTYKYLTSGNYTVNVTAKSAGGQTISQSVPVAVVIKTSLVWSDEFDTPGSPDATKWGFDTGAGGWGNNELEYYTSRTDNAIVSNGTLKIIAKAESYNGSAYTSARLLTKDKYSFKYGKIEVRAKLPAPAGSWPAIWMLGNNFATAGWPACGEIDIMESRGNEPDKIYGTTHDPSSGGVGNGGTTVTAGSTTDFHRYAVEWSAASVKFMVDDVVYYTFPNTGSSPFNQNFFIILNLAIGGNFGGNVDPAFTSAVMEVDYVRVYQ